MNDSPNNILAKLADTLALPAPAAAAPPTATATADPALAIDFNGMIAALVAERNDLREANAILENTARDAHAEIGRARDMLAKADADAMAERGRHAGAIDALQRRHAATVADLTSQRDTARGQYIELKSRLGALRAAADAALADAAVGEYSGEYTQGRMRVPAAAPVRLRPAPVPSSMTDG